MSGMCRKISQERLIILFFHTAFPDLQMSGNNHLLDRFVSPYLFDEQTAGRFTHQIGLVGYGRKLRLYIINVSSK